MQAHKMNWEVFSHLLTFGRVCKEFVDFKHSVEFFKEAIWVWAFINGQFFLFLIQSFHLLQVWSDSLILLVSVWVVHVFTKCSHFISVIQFVSVQSFIVFLYNPFCFLYNQWWGHLFHFRFYSLESFFLVRRADDLSIM